MEKIRLGKTGLTVSRTGFGAIPIQRINIEEAKSLLLRAFEAGINYFDTARSYSDSEKKVGYAFSGIREKVIIATKTQAKNKKELDVHIQTSLRELNSDYIDVYQTHNPAEVYPEVYEGLLELKQRGVVKHIGITYHSREKAAEAVKSGKFETLQFPLTFLSSDEDLELIELCKKHDVGLLAMKGLAGGLISDASCAFAFLRQYENVVPLWGVERRADLEEFISLEKLPPILDAAITEKIEEYKKELSGNFCRGCGYCMPCPANIMISTCARIIPLMSRARFEDYITDEFSKQMEKIETCAGCGKCKEKCPYGLNIPELLKSQLSQYRKLRK